MRLVVDLFESDKTIMPEHEAFDLAVLSYQVAALDNSVIEVQRRGQPREPSSHVLIRYWVGWEEEGKCVYGLFDEIGGKYGAMSLGLQERRVMKYFHLGVVIYQTKMIRKVVGPYNLQTSDSLKVSGVESSLQFHSFMP